MTPAEYVQLKAFARVDGLSVAFLWVGSFACYLVGLQDASWGVFALLLAVVSPVFVAWRLRWFRDVAREGSISFGRGWAYVVLVFFYAGLLYALAQYAYFAFMDNGYLMKALEDLFSLSETQQMVTRYGMGDALSESMQQLRMMRPIDMALQMLTTNIMLGMVLGVPIAALMKKKV